MTDNKLYPNLPSAPPEAIGPCSAENPQVAYHLSIIQAKMRGLKKKGQMFVLVITWFVGLLRINCPRKI